MSENSDRADDRRPSSWFVLIGFGALAAGLVLMLGLPAVLGQEEGDAPSDPMPVVEAVPATAEGETYEIVEEGFLRPRARVDIVPEVAGKVVEVADDLRLGRRFEEGALLFRLDPTPFTAELDQARANLAAAQAAATRARAEYDRQENLAEIGATATARLQAAEAEFRSTDAQVAQARAAVTLAEDRLADSELRAPFDAIIEREDVAVGQYLAPGNAVVTLYDADVAEVVVSLPPKDAAAVRRAFTEANGQLSAAIEPAAASALTETLTGEVSDIALGVSREGRTVDILVSVANAFGEDRAGRVFADDFVSVRLPARSDAPLYSATEGVIRKQRFVWVIDEESRLRRVDVSPVRRTREQVTFTGAADLSDRRLVTTALTEEAEGMEVRVVEGTEGDGSRMAQRDDAEAP